MLVLNQTRSKISKAWAEKALKGILRRVRVSGLDLDLTFVGDARIRTLNRSFRQKDKATDVLSFPLQDKKRARKGDCFLGDVVISVPTARRQAKEQGRPLLDELLFLIIHGTLHLLGYDHEKTLREAIEMQSLEKKIFEALRE